MKTLLKIKQLIFITIVLFGTLSTSYAQKIIDFYKMIDEKDTQNQKYKTIIIKRYYTPDLINTEEDDPHMYLKTVDEKNGYLRVEGAFEGFYEMCYWITKAGKKIIATNSTGCGPICSSKVTFYNYEDKKLIETQTLLPDIELKDLFNVEKLKKENPNLYTKAEKEFANTFLLKIELPQKGVNITADPQIEDVWDEKLLQELTPYKINYKIEYLWQDGNFIKKVIQ